MKNLKILESKTTFIILVLNLISITKNSFLNSYVFQYYHINKRIIVKNIFHSVNFIQNISITRFR